MVRVKMKVAMWAGLRSVRAHIMHLHTACTRVGVYKYMGSIRICSPPHISHDLCASVPATVGLCARTCVLRVPARARCSSRQRCRVLDADSSSTSRLIASGAPGGGLIFAKFKLRSRRALISHEKVQKVTKVRSSPIRASLFSNRIRKKQRQEDGRLQVRGYSDCRLVD